MAWPGLKRQPRYQVAVNASSNFIGIGPKNALRDVRVVHWGTASRSRFGSTALGTQPNKLAECSYSSQSSNLGSILSVRNEYIKLTSGTGNTENSLRVECPPRTDDWGQAGNRLDTTGIILLFDSAIPAGSLTALDTAPTPMLSSIDRAARFLSVCVHNDCGFSGHFCSTSLIDALERSSSHGPMISSHRSPS